MRSNPKQTAVGCFLRRWNARAARGSCMDLAKTQVLSKVSQKSCQLIQKIPSSMGL